jgi:hypothetical protein
MRRRRLISGLNDRARFQRKTTSTPLFVNRYPGHVAIRYAMHNDCAEVDELFLELVDYKNDFADVAAEKLLLKCSTSWEAYRYLQHPVHDAWLPDSAQQ